MRAYTYSKNILRNWPVPNYWDLVAFCFVVGIIAVLGWGAKSMVGHYHLGQTIPINLDPAYLPYYGLRTFLRMLIAMFFSLLFTFIFGTWAAKSKHAERIIIPFIDIMQSVPVLGFLSITIVGFVVLFQGSMLGPECAAIFAIFTAQVWNMALSFYQSLRTVPSEMKEAGEMFQLSAWQIFWRIEVPFAMPALLWNAMVSMSSSWVFLVASEAITVANQYVTLPGIGSYIDLAIQNKNVHAILYVILAMMIVIACYDQLLFRPLVAWAEKFKTEETSSEKTLESWVLDLFRRTRAFQWIGDGLLKLSDKFVNGRWLRRSPASKPPRIFSRKKEWFFVIVGNGIIAAAVCFFLYEIGSFIFATIPFSETGRIFILGLTTALRVATIIFICSLIWVPIGVFIGMNPRASQWVQPIVQFLAAFPATLFFPVVVLVIVRYHLNVNIWTTPLMMLGTQWYILFNVIAGTIALPKQMYQAVATLNVSGWLWWRRFILPGIFPYYVTGAITAAGGAWNYSILVEAVHWGNTTLYAKGLGAYITEAYTNGHFQQLALGIVVMSTLVVIVNRLLWRPLYRFAEERFKIK